MATDPGDQWPVVKPAADITVGIADIFVPSAGTAKINLEEQSAQSVFTGPRMRAPQGLSGPTLRRTLIVSFGALQALDAFSTMKALDNGAREVNPAMGAIASNRTALLAVKGGTAVATAYFAERLSKKHPKGAVVLMAVLNSAYVAIVANNYRIANRGR